MPSLEESPSQRQEVDGGSQGLGEGRGSWCFGGGGQSLSLARWKVLETEGGDGGAV